MKKNKKSDDIWIYWVLGIFSIILIFGLFTPFFIYYTRFGHKKLTFDYDILGTFGDFIGGSTNFIIGLLNIIATIFLAIVIKNLDKERFEEQKELDRIQHEQNLELQNNILIRNLREEKFKEFTLISERLINKIMDGGEIQLLKYEVRRTATDFLFITANNQHIFMTFRDKNKIDLLHKSLKPIDDHFDFLLKKVKEDPDCDVNDYELTTEIMADFSNSFNEVKNDLLKEIVTNQKIPNNMIPKIVKNKKSEI